MAFKVLVDLISGQDLSEGLLLPPIFLNKIPVERNSVKLRNSRLNVFRVRVQRVQDGRLRLRGGGWRAFVQAIEFPSITKLCFIKEGDNTFVVKCFNRYGVEFVVNQQNSRFAQCCLVETTEETDNQQELSHRFLNHLNRFDHRKVRVDGPCQGGEVSVCFDYDGPNDNGRAFAFYGSQWSTICTEHQVVPGLFLMFTNKGNNDFYFDVFNADGQCLHMNIPSDDEPNPTTDDYENHDSAEEEIIQDWLNYRCVHVQHVHNDENPFFFKKLEPYTVSVGQLTIPKDFVRDNILHTFNEADIYFGNLVFHVKMKRRIDRRRPDDKTHVVMKAEWGEIVKEAGLSMGKMMRFELNIQECVPGVLAVFELC